MDNADDKNEYAIGYGKPPKHSQFKKGQSGNPRGRRPGSGKSILDDLQKLLSSKIKIVEGGETKTFSRQQVLLKKCFNEAAKGDLRATKMLLDLGISQERIIKKEKELRVNKEIDEILSMSDEELEEFIADMDKLKN